MGLLDGGLQTIFGSIFGPLLLDGTLHKSSQMTDEGGSITESFSDYPIKAMEESYSDVVRAQSGYAATDVQLIVLQLNVPVVPTTDDEITLRDKRYAVAGVDQDPAQAAWTIRGTLIG